jgi:UDP-N-acetylmuramoyl-tripeptide--D-alanyl-D-alanine ligase
MIGPVYLQDWQPILEANLKGRNVPVTGVSTDTRTLQPGDVFVALVGDRFDGHEFIKEAQQRGASAVIVSEPVETSLPQLQVKDTLTALSQLAGWNRKRFVHPIIGVTGSSGKTTVKEMIAAILRVQGEAHATQGNFNNQIGVPLTLIRLASYHSSAVVELGASRAGDIDATAAICKPEVAVITNVSEAHIEGFGSLATTVKTKGAILDHIQAGGAAVLNADSPYCSQWVRRVREGVRIWRFGMDNSADVQAANVETLDNGEHAFQLRIHESNEQAFSQRIKLQVPGLHNVSNALAAAAAAYAAGVNIKDIKQGLESFVGVAGRLTERKGIHGALIIDDTYNANPASMRVAIEVAQEAKKTTFFVMGDMKELGEEALRAHADVGAFASRKGVTQLLAVGHYSRNAVESFGKGGHWFASKSALIEYLKEHITQDHVVLVKGSRGARMDKIVDALIEEERN